MLDAAALRQLLSKNGRARRQARACRASAGQTGPVRAAGLLNRLSSIRPEQISFELRLLPAARLSSRDCGLRRNQSDAPLIGLNRRNQVRDPEEALTNSPNTTGAQEQLGRLVHVTELQMVSVGDHVNGNANALRHDELRARAVNGFDQPPAEFSCVFQVQQNEPRRRARLVKGVNRFDEYRSSVGQKKQLADRLSCGKQERPFVKIDLDFEFRF